MKKLSMNEDFTPIPENELLDDICLYQIHKLDRNPTAWYLVAAYTYYVHDYPLISDGLFDKLSKVAKPGYGVTEDDLSAGTFLGKYDHLQDAWFEITRGILRKDNENKHLEKT